MLVKLAYGRSGLQITVPDDRTTVIEPEYVAGLDDEIGVLRASLRNPIRQKPLRSLVGKDQKVSISVCDITRPMPSRRVLPEVLGELDHLPRDQITILVATGTHRGNTPEELQEMLNPEVVDNYQVINHSAFDDEMLVGLGDTPDGIPVWLNRHWIESDMRITTGFVEPHFFAGFSGGPKMVAPGLAGFKTIIELHGARLIRHPHSTWGIIEGNPIHDAIRWIAQQTGVNFSVDVTINRDHQITGVFAGDLFSAHQAACSFARETAMRAVPGFFDVVITTNSGYPLDLNLYQSVKGMAAAARVVRPGGTIICAAECSDGIPEHGHYGKILSAGDSPRELLELINSPGYRRHDQWQVQLQAQIQLRAKVCLKSSFLTPEQVRAAHLEPIENVEGTLAAILAEQGDQARICVLPQGPQTIPFVEEKP